MYVLIDRTKLNNSFLCVCYRQDNICIEKNINKNKRCYISLVRLVVYTAILRKVNMGLLK